MQDKGVANTRIDFLCCFNAYFAGLQYLPLFETEQNKYIRASFFLV